jgi:hypothetical protein
MAETQSIEQTKVFIILITKNMTKRRLQRAERAGKHLAPQVEYDHEWQR